MSQPVEKTSLSGRSIRIGACCVLVLTSFGPVARAQEHPPAGLATPDGAVDLQAEPEVTPPEPIERIEAVFPPEALAAREEGHVVLLVTVAADGTVDLVTVAESGGEAFDQAAIAAVKQWRFEPARRGDQPVAARIQVPFTFTLPKEQPPPPAPPPPQTAPPAAVGPPAAGTPASEAEPGAAAPEEQPLEVDVKGRRPPPPRASSDFVLDRDVLTVAPHQDAGSVLGSAPGVYVARPEGEAVAHEIFLRGFDAEHGQDVALSAAGIPINQPSHLHGQGYADLGFIPPEVIRSVRVTEGVYDPRQGDFAVAGSVDFDLGVAERGVTSRTSVGSFGTQRQLLLWAPPDEDEETFGVFVVRRSSGFGENRGSVSGTGMGQQVLGSPRNRTVLHASAYGARASLAGVLRRDDVESGSVGFYDAYDDPTANAQSAFASRWQLGARHESRPESGARTAYGVWLLGTDFKLRENFTGYRERSRENPEWVGRGDLVEQTNVDTAVGGNASYRTPYYRPASWARGTLELGLGFRADTIDQQQNLLQPPQNETWDRRVDATIRGADLGGYVDTDWRLSRYFRARGGVRADALYYDVDDRLGNFIPTFRRETYIVGFRRTALGLAVGPRGTLEARPWSWLTLLGSYGRGYRSPQARQLDEGESAPYATVDSGEVGAKAKLGPRGELEATAAGFWTHLSLDLAFDPAEGRLERIGPTTRRGLVVHTLLRPLRWALASLSVTWVQATLDAPPPPTSENPTPPFRRGELLPYVPPIVVRADTGVEGDLFVVGGALLHGKAGFGLTYLSPRPLPYGTFADPVLLTDVSSSLAWRAVELGFEVTNLLDAEYAATEYSFVSDWGTSPTPSLLPAEHFSAGPPRAVLFTLGLHL